MFTIFYQINDLKSLVFIKKSQRYIFCFQAVLKIGKWPPCLLFPASYQAKNTSKFKKIASLVFISNAFHAFTHNKDGVNTTLLPRFNPKQIWRLYMARNPQTTAHEISPGDLIPGGVLMMGTHGAEKKLALALSSPLVAHRPHWFNGLQSAFLAFMNYSWDCKTIKCLNLMYKSWELKRDVLMQTDGWY